MAMEHPAQVKMQQWLPAQVLPDGHRSSPGGHRFESTFTLSIFGYNIYVFIILYVYVIICIINMLLITIHIYIYIHNYIVYFGLQLGLFFRTDAYRDVIFQRQGGLAHSGSCLLLHAL
jgi:hypothetical protein